MNQKVKMLAFKYGEGSTKHYLIIKDKEIQRYKEQDGDFIIDPKGDYEGVEKLYKYAAPEKYINDGKKYSYFRIFETMCNIESRRVFRDEHYVSFIDEYGNSIKGSYDDKSCFIRER